MNKKKSFVIGVNGSPKKGRVFTMLKKVMSGLEGGGVETKIINLYDYRIVPHTGLLETKGYAEKTKDDFVKLQEIVLKADGIVFATPTHWFSQSSQLKLFIDRLTGLEHHGFLLEGKIGGVIAYGPEGGALNNAMNLLMIMNQWGMVVPPYGALFDEGRKDKWFKKDLKLLAKNMIVCLKSKTNSYWGY